MANQRQVEKAGGPRNRRRRNRTRRASDRRDRPRRPRFNLRKAMFVLPNLFTVSSIFCGFYAVVLASGDPGPVQMTQAGLAVFFGLFFDMVDGRVARLTKTQSEFGVQLDSLADVITFGVAPAVIVHKWGLSRLGLLGALAAFTYAACGAIRLARFNVMAARSGGGATSFFVGLPIPLAAAVLVTLMMFHQTTFAGPVLREAHILILILVLSYLMVSNVRYRSFKKIKPSPRVLATLVLLLVSFGVLAVMVSPSFSMFILFGAYVLLGMVEEVVFFRRRRREEREARESEDAPRSQPDPPRG